MYSVFAEWFHLLTAPADYADEASFYTAIIKEAHTGAFTLLELGSGGGNNASFMKAHFDCTLTDLSPEMLDLSKQLNPECEHIKGDMRTLRLGRTFDAVFLHDAVMYMTTENDLRAAIATAAVHTRAGGVALFLPDFITETFEETTEHGGHDGADGRSLRYLDWVRRVDETTYEVDYAVLLREPGKPVRVEHDTHREGLFPRNTWLRLFAEAGLEQITPNVPDPYEDEHVVFLLRKPA